LKEKTTKEKRNPANRWTGGLKIRKKNKTIAEEDGKRNYAAGRGSLEKKKGG